MTNRNNTFFLNGLTVFRFVCIAFLWSVVIGEAWGQVSNTIGPQFTTSVKSQSEAQNVRSLNASGIKSEGQRIASSPTGDLTRAGDLQVENEINRKPQPGDLYKEFSLHNGGDRDWRVTDKDAVIKFDRAKHHLPNSRLTLAIDDLEHAVRAEVLLDRWGGHRGTINKRIRFNEKSWITIPEIQNTPEGIRPEMLMFQDNPVVAVPLDQLKEGDNAIDADCDEEGGFGWGQWGLYSIVLRIYYDPASKADDIAISGRIAEPLSNATIFENPNIVVEADAEMGVARIDVLASHDGFDEDGDGNFCGWHESHFQLVLGEANEIRDHVGTMWKKPYQLNWDTKWVPDQEPKSVSLIARIQDSRGYWTVTEPVSGLSLKRDAVTVKLYRSYNVPEDFAVRVDETKHCFFDIPGGDPISSESEARLHLRTWHGWDGHHEPLRVNGHELKVDGKNHFYDYDLLELPASALKHGKNRFTIHSKTEHHMLEVLWPGPAVVTRTPLTKIESKIKITEDTYENRPHFVVDTEHAIYWLDRNSGGLSRLIDSDGKDWIAFKTKPWDEYPPSAASSFRGLPNLVFNGDDKGFGHPGWDKAESNKIDSDSIVCKSKTGNWKMRWDFSNEDATLTIETADPRHPYWFLYEGPIAGRWAPSEQYFATDKTEPSSKPHDFFNNEKLFGNWRWAYFGDKTQLRVLAIEHDQADDLADTFSHLGNSESGLDSSDGMVVFGFGRAKGTKPTLTGNNSFRIKFVERSGFEMDDYRVIKRILN